MSVADKYTLERKKQEIYSDFHTSFEISPISGLLSRVTNEESVKQSIKNILLTELGERFYDSSKGSRLKQNLFELVDFINLDIMKSDIIQLLKAREPRANIMDIRVDDNIDNNTIGLTLVFSIINIPNNYFDLTLNIKRVR